MRFATLILLVLTQLSNVIAFQSFQDFFPDGKYCLQQEIKNKEGKRHQSCTDPINIRTKYPYLIIWKENRTGSYDHGINVVKPESWPDLKKSKSEEDRKLHFTLNNASFHLYFPHQHHNLVGKAIKITLKLNGVLLAQSL